MIHATLVTATDLNRWAATRLDAQATLPQLVRRLVRESVGRVERLHFRAHEGVLFSGWDGIVQVEVGNAFVPDGTSGWEMGTNKGIKGKADGDYTTRSADPLGLEPAHTTFVFVTPRRWSDKEKWSAEKRQEKRWKDVRAYDADDLETWLEDTPAVHIWFSRVAGQRPAGVIDLSGYWEEWSGVTQPSLSPELVIAGREDTAERIHQWLSGEPSALEIQSETLDEAVAFFAAALHQMPEEEHEWLFARSLVVEDPTVWRQLATVTTPLILIPAFVDRTMVPHAATAGHHVMIPLGRNEPIRERAVQIPRIRRGAAKKALKDMNFTGERAEALATFARRSLAALRRKLSSTPAVLTPVWAKPHTARVLLSVVLAGRWSDRHPGDREAIARLAGWEYTEVSETVLRWAHEADPPVRRVGDTWMVVSNEDAWSLLASYLTRDDLERFETVVLDVLGAVNPRYELSPGQRWVAALYGKTPSHSSHLCEGLADTLALMGASSDLYPLGDSHTGQEWATRIVHRLFERTRDWPLWASLSGHLPALAEAAPEEFLAAVEQGLAGEPSVLISLFTDAEHHLMESSPHTGLLWGLEVLAWSPEYLGRAVLLLAKLTRIDPGGKLANRPKESLQKIFLCWHACTAATLEQRLRVLDTLRKQEPQVAWSLLMNLLPNRIPITSNTAEPRWRAWVPEDRPPVTYGELFRAGKEIVTRLLAAIGTDGERWHHLIKALDALPEAEFEAVVAHLRALGSRAFSPTDRAKVWSGLRDVISRHLEFSDVEWALPRERVKRLQRIYTRFKPDDPLVQWSWLFANEPAFPHAGYTNLRKREKAIARARVQAVKELFRLGGLPMLLEFTRCVDQPWHVGGALGQSDLLVNDEAALLADTLGSPDVAKRNMAFGFLHGRSAVRGQGWIEAFRERDVVKTWNPQQRADFYRCLPFSGHTWDALEATNAETQCLYWREVSIYGRGDMTGEDCERPVMKLVEYGRLENAVKFLSLYLRRSGDHRFQPQRIADVLERIVRRETTEAVEWGGLAYDISRLLGIIEGSGEIDDTQIAKLEWFFLPLLQHSEHTPKVLHRALAEDPSFFVDVLSWVYKAENEEPRDVSEEQRVRAQLADDLLNSWRQPPGLGEDGAVDAEKLGAWVARVRALASARGRGAIGDQRIGEVLVYYPQGSDDAWPHEAVRDLLEEVASEDLEQGIYKGIFNSRGLVSRAIGEGGVQERELAMRYHTYARLLNDGWPRTAGLMRQVAEAYGSDARREDTEAELTEDLWR